MRKINGFISGTHKDLVIATLKLLNAISSFAGGTEQKSLLDAFVWDVKVGHRSSFTAQLLDRKSVV